MIVYLQRDVRLLQQVGDLSRFNRFLRICAGRAGQLLNISLLARDADMAVNTAKEWLSVLEASYLVFLIQPYHKMLEIKASKTMNLRHFKGLAWWQKLAGTPPENCAVLYLGDEAYDTKHGKIIPWRHWAMGGVEV